MQAPALTSGRRLPGERLFVLALLLLFAAFAGQYTVKVLKPGNRSAFVRWREQIRQLEGADIYSTYQYPNPPIMALLLRPLAELGPLAGALLWFLLKVGMALISLTFVFRLIESGGVPFPPGAKAVATLLSLPPLIGDLQHGNVNILIMFLVIVALFAWHRGYDLLGGMLLALAVCCKVTPALFVPYFLWKRQWRLLAGLAVGLGLFLFEIPGAVLGRDENLALLQSWVNQMIVPFLKYGLVTSEHPNQSLPGVVHRLLTHSPSFCDYPGGIYRPTEYHNLADLGPTAARWLLRGLQALFGLMVVFVCRAPAKVRGGWRLATEFAIILVGMLLFSERTWKHHSVTLMLPFAVLVYAVAVRPLSRWVRIGVIAAVAAALLLMLSASGVQTTRMADLAQVYGVYMWAFLLILGALIACAFRARPLEAHGESLSMTQPVRVRR
ncbi:MAG: glycosyltransferase family 87 protein [Gemmataceae bacterium]